MKTERSTGVTLIELVIIIVVIGVGLIGLMAVILNVTARSTDPAIQQQAHAIAQAYMEEILSQPFCDPNDFATDCPAMCTTNACSCSGSTVPGGGPESRSTYDDVCDYNVISGEAASDINGPITALADYSVTVSVDDSGTAFNGLSYAGGEVVRIQVDVQHSNGFETSLTSYKANY